MKTRQVIMVVGLFVLLGAIYWQMNTQKVRPKNIESATKATAPPQNNSVTATDNSQQEHKQDIQPTPSKIIQNNNAITTTNNQPQQSINPMTGLSADKNDPKMIAKRQQVFMDITDIMTNMARGQKPESSVILTHAKDIVMLTNAGYVPKQDALNSLNFLRKAFPELDIELDRIAQKVPQPTS